MFRQELLSPLDQMKEDPAPPKPSPAKLKRAATQRPLASLGLGIHALHRSPAKITQPFEACISVLSQR